MPQHQLILQAKASHGARHPQICDLETVVVIADDDRV